MLLWLTENMGTIVISLVLLIIIAAVIVSEIRAHKYGRTSCGCGCKHCAMRGKCHNVQ